MWQFISNVIVFLVIYLLSTFVANFMQIFNPNPKLIYIKSQSIYNFIVFPGNIIYRPIKKKKTCKKDTRLMLSELIFCLLNQATLVGAIVLQLIPPIPCDVIEVTFGARHRGLDFIVDTYNQKIPLCLIFSLLCTEVLFLFGAPLFRSFRDKPMRKKLGVGAIIGIIAICTLCLILLSHFIYLLF
ncbi:MAG: hypothetical protein IJW49_05835 [Clostridia bacterium]|nr:hypothetical protein [Clostridia bacterium]